MGLAVRAKGSGLRVLFVQFLKSRQSGELGPLRDLGIEVVSGQPSGKFVFQMDEEEKAANRIFHRQRLADAWNGAGQESISWSLTKSWEQFQRA